MKSRDFLYRTLLLLYRKNKIFRKLTLKFLLKAEGGYAYSKGIRYIYREYFGIIIGYGSYGGCFDVGKIRKGVSFGNYCSIAHNVTILTANHPINSFTTHPILYEPSMGFVKTSLLRREKINIGNDVWIGQNVVVLPTCIFIGNGAVIGAGSIVTKDVPAYSIVVGNPAKVIRMRFKEEIIEKLEVTQWWLWDKETLIKNIDKLERIVRGED